MLSVIPETDHLEDIKEEGSEEDKSSTSPRSSPLDITREIVRLVVESSEGDLFLNHSDTSRPQTEVLGSTFVEVPEIETGSFPEQITTAPLPSADSFSSSPVGPLEDLPALPPSEPSTRPSTPDPVGESIYPKLRESHLNEKAKAELRLPTGVSRVLLGDQDLPLPSPDQSAESEYTNVSQPNDDPEDEDPSLSSFGDGIVQTVPVAQVGLRNPMFPGASGFGLLLGAINSPTQRFFPQGLDINDESVHDSAVPEKDSEGRSTLSIGIDASTEDGGEGDKGEEGWNSLS